MTLTLQPDDQKQMSLPFIVLIQWGPSTSLKGWFQTLNIPVCNPGVTVDTCFIINLRFNFLSKGYAKGREKESDILKTFICLVNRAIGGGKKRSYVSARCSEIEVSDKNDLTLRWHFTSFYISCIFCIISFLWQFVLSNYWATK